MGIKEAIAVLEEEHRMLIHRSARIAAALTQLKDETLYGVSPAIRAIKIMETELAQRAANGEVTKCRKGARVLSASGREAISRAVKKRWAKHRRAARKGK
jgi:hypothetical protein